MTQPYQYEYVFETKDKLYARIYDPNTNTSELKQYHKSEYIPPLYLPAKEGEYTSHVKESTILKEYTFGSMQDYRDFYANYENSTLVLHGNKSIIQHYIRTNFPDTEASNHEFRGWHLDIETRNIIKDMPFNEKASKALEEISLVQFYDTYEKEFYLLTTKDYDFKYTTELGKINFIVYANEYDMMRAFVKMLKTKDPVYLNGFNTYMFDYPYIIKRLRILGIAPEHLSPVGMIKSKPATNKDGIEYEHYDIVGRILLDYRELYLKYSFAKLPRYNLESIATYELGEGKVNHDEFTDFEDFYQNQYGLFLEYGNRDIELLLMLENKLKLIETAKFIAYKCGVNIPEVFGTYKQWHSYMYNKALSLDIVLPIKQQYSVSTDVFPGGWIGSIPNRYNYVASFDFSALYPSVIRVWNIGLDTLVKPEEMPDELKIIKEKYFSWYNEENFNKLKELNSHPDEHTNMMFILENKEEIRSALIKYDVTVSPNGYFYRKNKEGLFPKLLKDLAIERKASKKIVAQCDIKLKDMKETDEGYETIKGDRDYNSLREQVVKLKSNSAYGSLSMEINSFSHGKGFSAAVTTGGRFCNRLANYYMNQVLAKIENKENFSGYDYTLIHHTDSGYISISYIINKIIERDGAFKSKEELIQTIDKVCVKFLEPAIKKAIDEIHYTFNVYDETVMDMEKEVLSDGVVAVTNGKYYCRYYKEKDGKLQTKYKITGLSLVGKSTPPYCKEKLTPVMDIILDEESKDLVDYIEDIRKDFVNQPIQSISVIKGVSSIDYDKSTFKTIKNGKSLTAPIHSRGSIIHNNIVTERKMDIPHIVAGDKVYYTYLKLPNPIMSDVISYNDPRFMTLSGLLEYVDYNTLFEKNFKKSISLITEPIGWSLDPYQDAMDDWF